MNKRIGLGVLLVALVLVVAVALGQVGGTANVRNGGCAEYIWNHVGYMEFVKVVYPSATTMNCRYALATPPAGVSSPTPLPLESETPTPPNQG